MERYVFMHGGIYARDGKIVRRRNREFFRMRDDGREIPIERTAETLTEIQKIIHPECY